MGGYWSDEEEQANCVLEVCCGGADSKQPVALQEFLMTHANLAKHDARRAANVLISTFDFAQKGTLVAFKQSIAKLARGHDYE
jgi:hypothetical protein